MHENGKQECLKVVGGYNGYVASIGVNDKNKQWEGS